MSLPKRYSSLISHVFAYREIIDKGAHNRCACFCVSCIIARVYSRSARADGYTHMISQFSSRSSRPRCPHPSSSTSPAALITRSRGFVLSDRTPCNRMTGQNAHNWNKRIKSSWNSGSWISPPVKPPMSVVHHGIPEMPMLRPIQTCLRRMSNRLWMSPLHTSAPYRWSRPTRSEPGVHVVHASCIILS